MDGPLDSTYVMILLTRTEPKRLFILLSLLFELCSHSFILALLEAHMDIVAARAAKNSS